MCRYDEVFKYSFAKMETQSSPSTCVFISPVFPGNFKIIKMYGAGVKTQPKGDTYDPDGITVVGVDTCCRARADGGHATAGNPSA